MSKVLTFFESVKVSKRRTSLPPAECMHVVAYCRGVTISITRLHEGKNSIMYITQSIPIPDFENLHESIRKTLLGILRDCNM